MKTFFFEPLMLLRIYLDFFFPFFLRMGTQNGHNAPFLESASLGKRKKAMKTIKQKYKISKKSNKKKSCHLVPKVVIDLPFESSFLFLKLKPTSG